LFNVRVLDIRLPESNTQTDTDQGENKENGLRCVHDYKKENGSAISALPFQ
jgi:hypothetical protein